MNKHTPAPWLIYENNDDPKCVMFGITCRAPEHLDSDGDGADICEMQNEGYFGIEVLKANAQLIAAAPELLEACAEARIQLELAGMKGCRTDKLCEVAIAKARGES